MQSILSHKEFLEDACKRVLGEEIQKKNILTEMLNYMANEKKTLIETQTKMTLTSSLDFMNYIQYHQKLENDIQNKYLQIGIQDDVIKQKTILLNKAVVERKKMDKLKEKQFKLYKKETLRQEVKVLDEVSGRSNSIETT